jgi:tetratricopeptide (TPR) repeat protein
MPWRIYLWPGLTQVYRRGAWSALGVAVGFTALLNLALASSLLWSELLTPPVRNTVWGAVVMFWAASAILSYRWDRRQSAFNDSRPAEDSFPQALDHYLKGNWFEAEQVLCGLLRANPWDVDAGLLLATLLRHTRRFDEAKKHLDRLVRLDGAEKWHLEIARERELLGEAQKEGANASSGQAAEKTADPPGEVMEAA